MHDEWLERWQIGRTGWHEPAGNRNLQQHWRARGKLVLVPLCGKTPDLLWLEAQGNHVVGVELSELAVHAFFDENDLAFERSEGPLTRYQAEDRNVTLYCGDYFEFDAGLFDAHYDRGALVALTPELRKRYVRHTSSLLTADAEQLVISVEYDQSVCDGPPFSLDSNEVQGYWPRLKRVARVDDTENAPPKFLDAGLTLLHEVVWRTA
ncbi:MAG: thiopurine S-methyltransferase [Gammaproteobacteria bacterium]|nr:thiopurine S-methyltransferase [Gammaproteobacteria bacterium]